jgi:hypothetical protein
MANKFATGSQLFKIDGPIKHGLSNQHHEALELTLSSSFMKKKDGCFLDISEFRFNQALDARQIHLRSKSSGLYVCSIIISFTENRTLLQVNFVYVTLWFYGAVLVIKCSFKKGFDRENSAFTVLQHNN